MLLHRTRLLIPILVIVAGVMTAAACGGSEGPDLPDTTAASVLAYLEEWTTSSLGNCGPASARSTLGGPSRYAPDNLYQPASP